MKPTGTRKIISVRTQKFFRLFGIAFGIVALLYSGSGAQAQTTQVIRGTVTAVSNGVYTVKPDNGGSVQVRLSPPPISRNLLPTPRT